jgi:hypothetical protein
MNSVTDKKHLLTLFPSGMVSLSSLPVLICNLSDQLGSCSIKEVYACDYASRYEEDDIPAIPGNTRDQGDQKVHSAKS